VQAFAGGRRCRVGIPPTVLHVLYIDVLDVPQDTGMLPRPSGWLVTLPVGVSFDPTEPVGLLVELIAAWEPDGPTPGVEVAEPIRMELVFRPYAFLADGDVVTDSGGRRGSRCRCGGRRWTADAGLALVGPVLLTGRCACLRGRRA
jgi:hypothetical protein